MTSEQDVVLGFYSGGGLLWLWIDLNAVSPGVLPWADLPLKPPPHKSPLHLFLRAHFTGRALNDISFSPERGRVLILRFGKEGGGPRLEIRAFPHGRNVLAFADGKRLAWQKPQELPESKEPPARGLLTRSLEELREEWLEQKSRRKSGAKKPKDVKSQLENQLEKKRGALAKVDEELRRKKEMPWRAAGDWLKAHQSLEVPKEFEPFVDRRRKLSWNIEECYGRARELEGKIFGTENRRALLAREIGDMEKKLAGPIGDLARAVPEKPKVSLADIEAQGRTLRLERDLTAVAGKSAADNMKILRKARPWDLWFHLRDYPSSHAVLFRNKTAKVHDQTLLRVAEWFLRTHFGEKAARHAGEKFTVVVAECRHVKPVRGDKIGRVTYHDERVLICRLPK